MKQMMKYSLNVVLATVLASASIAGSAVPPEVSRIQADFSAIAAGAELTAEMTVENLRADSEVGLTEEEAAAGKQFQPIYSYKITGSEKHADGKHSIDLVAELNPGRDTAVSIDPIEETKTSDGSNVIIENQHTKRTIFTTLERESSVSYIKESLLKSFLSGSPSDRSLVDVLQVHLDAMNNGLKVERKGNGTVVFYAPEDAGTTTPMLELDFDAQQRLASFRQYGFTQGAAASILVFDRSFHYDGDNRWPSKSVSVHFTFDKDRKPVPNKKVTLGIKSFKTGAVALPDSVVDWALHTKKITAIADMRSSSDPSEAVMRNLEDLVPQR